MSARRTLDRRIVRLALPAAASSALQLIHATVDMFWVGQLGTEALAALAIATMTVWMFLSIGSLMAIGITALVARYVGVGRAHAAAYVTHQGLLWSAVLGVVVAALGFALAVPIYRATDAEPVVAAMGVAYTRIFWGAGALMLLQIAADAAWRGYGNTRVPLYAGGVALLTNLGLDPLLIHGWGPFPRMGVPGAAWATVIATALGVLLVVGALVRYGRVSKACPSHEELRLAPTTRFGRPGWLGLDAAVFRRIARVGAPVAASGLFFTGIYLVLQNIAAQAGGSAAQAGLGVGHRGEGLAWVVCTGWAAAASSLVGQSLGAGRPDEAARAAWRCVLHAVILCFVWGVFLMVAADAIAGFLTGYDAADAVAREHAVQYFLIVGLVLGPQAIEFVLDGAFGGAGQTLPPFVISSAFSVARMPLAWLAAIPLGLGVNGIWWVISITALLRGLTAGAWFRRGRWKTQTV